MFGTCVFCLKTAEYVRLSISQLQHLLYCLPLADLMHRLMLNSFLNESDDSASDDHSDTAAEGESDARDLVSTSEKSDALLRPVPFYKETCPKETCTYTWERAGTPLAICSSCGQWFHCRCVGLTKHQANKLSQEELHNCQ